MKSCVLNVNVSSIAKVSSILLSTCFHRKGRGRSAALIGVKIVFHTFKQIKSLMNMISHKHTVCSFDQYSIINQCTHAGCGSRNPISGRKIRYF